MKKTAVVLQFVPDVVGFAYQPQKATVSTFTFCSPGSPAGNVIILLGAAPTVKPGHKHLKPIEEKAQAK